LSFLAKKPTQGLFIDRVVPPSVYTLKKVFYCMETSELTVDLPRLSHFCGSRTFNYQKSLFCWEEKCLLWNI